MARRVRIAALADIRHAALAACLGLAAGSPADAGPLDPRSVPTEAAWVIHLDVEAIRGSRISAAARRTAIDADVASKLRAAADTLGIDPFADLADATLVGWADGAEPALLVEGTPALDAVLPRLGARSLVGEGSDDWLIVGESGDQHFARARSEGDRRWLAFSDARDSLARLWNTTEPAHALTEPPPAPGTILFLNVPRVSDLLTAPGLPRAAAPASTFFQRVRGAHLEIGEHDGHCAANLTVTTTSESDASELARLAQAMATISRLAMSSEPDAAHAIAMFDGLTITAEGSSIHARFSMPTSEVLEWLRGADPPPEPLEPPPKSPTREDNSTKSPSKDQP